MGWCEGSSFAEKYIEVCEKFVKDEKTRLELYKKYIDFLCDQDWDTEDETIGIDPVWDAALKEYFKEQGWEWPE